MSKVDADLAQLKVDLADFRQRINRNGRFCLFALALSSAGLVAQVVLLLT